MELEELIFAAGRLDAIIGAMDELVEDVRSELGRETGSLETAATNARNFMHSIERAIGKRVRKGELVENQHNA